jgi:hypothetical protein
LISLLVGAERGPSESCLAIGSQAGRWEPAFFSIVEERRLMSELLISLGDMIIAAWGVLKALSTLLLPWLPLAAWVLFWLCAVNWNRFREVLIPKGGLLGLLLIGTIMVLIWGVIAPPPSGTHFIFGLKVSNYIGKLIYVTGLFCLMFLCGSVQLSGCCQRWCALDSECDSDQDPHPPHHATIENHGV